MTQAAPARVKIPHKIPTTSPRRVRAARRAAEEGQRPRTQQGPRGRHRTRGNLGRRRGHRAGVRDHRVPRPDRRWRVAGSLVRGRPAAAVRGRRGGRAPVGYPLPCGSVHRRYVCALTWQYPFDQAAHPCGQRREGSEGGRGVDPAEHRLHRADLSDAWYSLTAGTMLQRGASC